MGCFGEDDTFAEFVSGERGKRDGRRDVRRMLDVEAEKVAKPEAAVSAETKEGLAGLCGEASLRVRGD